MKKIEIDGVTHYPISASGNRAVVVVDRGWIFAGDVSDEDGRIRITRALHVFGWSSIGFAKILEEPKSDKVDLRPCTDVDVPASAEIFRVPVDSEWGL